MAYCGQATQDNAKYLASKTGLDWRVVYAWLRNECQATPNPTNPLNIRYYGTRTQQHANSSGFAVYSSTRAGLDDAAWLINNSGYYSGVRAAIRTGDAYKEARAIELSPWAAGHYGGATSPGHIYTLLQQLITGTAGYGQPTGPGSGTGTGVGSDLRSALTDWLAANGKTLSTTITEADATAFFTAQGLSPQQVQLNVGILRDAGRIGGPWSGALGILSGIFTPGKSADPLTAVADAIGGIGDVLGKLAGFGSGLVLIILGVFIYTKSVRSRVENVGPPIPVEV